ncbi:camphor resistance protein CrcB [Seinonella peptonophila]|uniref:Fluoride-specific ion channel FluC n=1 Tax=Seinonella peptonophila TaxID=112248 RepID=A0A1M4ZJ83_9BACL|nr:CrcB family protein [Seinonella peptonophila]SHF18130.1 camphor resistance protein CrcB [Seinonella peptonophila]
MLKHLFWVGLGGIVGTFLRACCSFLFVTPWGTLFVNLAGCFFLALLFSWNQTKKVIPTVYHDALGAGVMGSLTTFSTFITEIFLLPFMIEKILYLMASVIGGITFAYIGYWLGRGGFRKEVINR